MGMSYSEKWGGKDSEKKKKQTFSPGQLEGNVFAELCHLWRFLLPLTSCGLLQVP